jgi:hypothetical protein
MRNANRKRAATSELGLRERATARPKIYAGYTRCDCCGIYSSNPVWCVSCGKDKTGPVVRDVQCDSPRLLQ